MLSFDVTPKTGKKWYPKMTIWIATSNKGKAKEFKLLLPNAQLYFLKDIKSYKSPEETGSSFEENARIKAQALRKYKPKEWVIGEDSGLIVPALNKAPGIYSARYAGPHATDEENLNLLLKNMKHLKEEKRSAAFISYIIALSPEEKEYSVEGKIEGSISHKPLKGHEGFGYDPVFVPKKENQSMAQLGLEYKNHYSHRAQAIQLFLKKVTA